MNVVKLTRELVDIASVSGQEGEVGEFLCDLLGSSGWDCLKQEVEPDRFNVLATKQSPSILLTTHIDTVPPFFPSYEDHQFVYGRGACDAKGIAAAMICAAETLVSQEVTDVGLLFVVGEETDSAGARKARELDVRCNFVVDGEPTDNQLVVAHKGIIAAQLSVQGVASHSAYPERGDSAIHRLLDILKDLRERNFPVHSTLGPTYLNIGVIRGGTALNVLAESAEARILIRTVDRSQRYLEILREVVGDRGQLKGVNTREPQEMEAVEGFPTKVVGYGTDVPALRSLGRPLLFGPGSILEAHTADEKMSKLELAEGVRLYQQLVQKLKKKLSQ